MVVQFKETFGLCAELVWYCSLWHFKVKLPLIKLIGSDKQKCLSIKVSIFSYPSNEKYVVGAQKNRLVETVLLSTHNICFG